MEQIQMLLPVKGVDPLLRNLAQQTTAEAEEEESEEHWTAHVDWNHAYDSVKVPATAQWGELSITAGDLLKLKGGDIIPLDPKRLGKVEVQLAGKTKFIGRMGSFEKKAAIQISDYFKA